MYVITTNADIILLPEQDEIYKIRIRLTTEDEVVLNFQKTEQRLRWYKAL